jgi:hypothetical protein
MTISVAEIRLAYGQRAGVGVSPICSCPYAGTTRIRFDG